jgi:ankyrin repeat protein
MSATPPIDEYIARIRKPFHLSEAWVNFESREFLLTGKSIKLFDLGCPGQGYIGIVDSETDQIHLIPAFNDGDGIPRRDRLGGDFGGEYVTSKVGLGQGGHNAHLQAVIMCGLAKSREKNGLMGFSFWKGGLNVRFLSHVPKENELIPDEYICVHTSHGYVFYHVNHNLHCLPLTQKQFIYKIKKHKSIQAFDKKKYRKSTSHSSGLKHFRNKSTHLNDGTTIRIGGPSGAITYDEMFIHWSNIVYLYHFSHTNEIPRTLPVSVTSKIIQSVTDALHLPACRLSKKNGFFTRSTVRHLKEEMKYQINPILRLFEVAILMNNRDLALMALQQGASFSTSKRYIDVIDRMIMPVLPNPMNPETSEIAKREIASIITRINLLLDLNVNEIDILASMLETINVSHDKDIKLKTFKDTIDALTEKSLIDTPSDRRLFKRRNTILSYLAHLGLLPDVIKKLANNGVDLTSLRICGQIARIAAKYDKVEIIDALVEAGVTAKQFHTADKYGRTPTFLAATKNNVKVIQALIKAGVTPNQLNQHDKKGRTPVSIAVERGYPFVIVALFRAGATLNQVDDNGLHLTKELYLGMGGFTENILSFEKGYLADWSTYLGKSPLMWAAICGHTHAIDAFIASGVTLEQLNEKEQDFCTLAWEAAAKGHAEVILSLMMAGLTPEQLNMPCLNYPSTLIAAVNGRTEVIRALIAAGLTPEQLKKGNFGRTPAMAAAQYDHHQIVALLEAATQMPRNEKDSALLEQVRTIGISARRQYRNLILAKKSPHEMIAAIQDHLHSIPEMEEAITLFITIVGLKSVAHLKTKAEIQHRLSTIMSDRDEIKNKLLLLHQVLILMVALFPTQKKKFTVLILQMTRVLGEEKENQFELEDIHALNEKWNDAYQRIKKELSECFQYPPNGQSVESSMINLLHDFRDIKQNLMRLRSMFKNTLTEHPCLRDIIQPILSCLMEVLLKTRTPCLEFNKLHALNAEMKAFYYDHVHSMDAFSLSRLVALMTKLKTSRPSSVSSGVPVTLKDHILGSLYHYMESHIHCFLPLSSETSVDRRNEIESIVCLLENAAQLDDKKMMRSIKGYLQETKQYHTRSLFFSRTHTTELADCIFSAQAQFI